MTRMIKTILCTVLLAAVCFGASANGPESIRINEILVKNVDNYEDDYGHRSSWIELHNTTHSSTDIGGYYLSAVTKDGIETLYRIPTGDPRTKIAPLGYCLFFCEGTGTKGVLYTNFTLENIERIALLNSSGRGKPIDEITLDYNSQLPDVSVGYTTAEDGTVTFVTLNRTTPNATNDMEPEVTRAEKFRRMDPYGAMMAIVAILVVLTVLTTLFLFFKLLGNYMVSVTRKKTAQSKNETKEELAGNAYDSPFSGEEVAAIMMALKMYTDQLHDKESAVLTINKVTRAYSPWSSKIYGLRQFTKK